MILIPLTECVPRRVYKLRCRNLTFGVYTGEGGFVGIRTKFNDRYLDTEYHWDFSERLGTVRGMEPTEYCVPDHIKLATIEGIRDQTTGRWLVWSHEVDNPNGGHLGKGWWTFADDGTPSYVRLFRQPTGGSSVTL